jgi:hypothetical protein
MYSSVKQPGPVIVQDPNQIARTKKGNINNYGPLFKVVKDGNITKIKEILDITPRRLIRPLPPAIALPP